MKKILSFILAALMTASCAAYVAADDAAVEETTSNAAQDYAIEFLANYGIFKGYSAEDTGADDDIQRYQMALFVSRISTGWVEDEKWEDGTANNATFKDIEEGAAANYLGAISYANQNGIIEGYTANTFAPYDNITYRDALTMVVRTLGYKGLTYPWGYIQKAVELELTEGIGSDVAYTDNLTRGEVATIIYNAMFANTAKGNTLAKSIFDIDFKWQNIVVVSTDEYTTVANNDGAVYAKEGYVGFKTIDAKTAALGDKVYYVKSEELGLAGHEEELAVGSVFTALFEAVDGNFVTLVDSDSAKIAEIFNNGITDNAGKAYETMPIAAALDAYELVKNYTNGVVNYTYNDLKVFGYDTVTVYDVDGNAANVGIDFATNNIVVWNEEDEAWEIAWFYNATLDKYYKYVVDTKNSKTDSKDVVYTSAEGNVYINWMSDAEFTKWYNEVIKEAVASYSELTLLEKAGDTMLKGEAPYSKLSLFDIDNDGIAEVANYKDYAIGIFANSSKECGKNAEKVNHADGKKYPTYKITSLDGEFVYEQFVEADHTAHEDAHKAQFAWVNVDPSVTTFVKEDGSYTDGVVVYRVNETTGEIEIVKHIIAGEGDDADSYITTGILQAYSTKNQTVTINGVTYPISYPNLVGDMYKMTDNDTANRMKWADTFDGQYMQYVSAVVCDGYVVDTDLVGETNNFIVVLGYAGITSDGYIAVYGYSTEDLTMKVFKINSYNGWKQGDYRYYPANADEDDAFEYGALYQIKSYDADTQSYGVYTENVSSVLASATPVSISFDKGYRVVQPMTVNNKGEWSKKLADDGKTVVDPSITKMDNADKYIVIDDANNPVTSKIFVYNGVVDTDYNYELTGYQINVGNDKIVIVYAMSNLVDGFGANGYEVGYVLYEKANGKVLDAAYDDAQVADWYLLGSTASEVTVLNLLTGERNVVRAATNVDLVNGHVYKTIGGTVIADVTDECNGSLHHFINKIEGAYHADDLKYADYKVAPITITADTAADIDLAFALGLVGDEDTTSVEDLDAIDAKIAGAMIHDSRTYYLTDDNQADVNIYGHGAITVEKLDKLAKDTTYYGWIVYDVNTTKTVIYVRVEDVAVTGTTDKVIDGAKGDEGKVLAAWNYSNDIKGEATLEADWAGVYNTVTRDGKTTNVSATIDEIALYFDVDKLDDHDDIAMAGYVFGMDDDHDESYFGYNDSKIKVVTDQQSDGTYKTVKEIVAQDMNKECYACDNECGMVRYISVSGLNITLNDKNPDAWVRFVINGDYGSNGITEGNNIEVCVLFHWDGEKVVVEYDGDTSEDNALKINTTTGSLQSITLNLIH